MILTRSLQYSLDKEGACLSPSTRCTDSFKNSFFTQLELIEITVYIPSVKEHLIHTTLQLALRGALCLFKATSVYRSDNCLSSAASTVGEIKQRQPSVRMFHARAHPLVMVIRMFR